MDQTIHAQTIRAERSGAHVIQWGAVIAGWLIAFSAATLFYVLGTALGISAAKAADEVNKGIAFGTIAWAFLSWSFSLFLGGLSASWLAGELDRMSGMLHGILVWGLSGLLTVLLGVAGIVQAGKAAGKTIGSGIMVTAPAAAGILQKADESNVGSQIAGNPAFINFQAQVKDQLSSGIAQSAGADADQVRQAVDRMSPQALSQVANALLQGNTDNAKNLMAINTGLNRAQIDRLINDAQQKTEEARAKVNAAVDKATDYTNAAVWTVFFTSFMGLVLAALGGMLGAHYMGYKEIHYSKRWHQEAA